MCARMFWILEALEAMRHVLPCMLKAVESEFCLLDVMRCMLLCMLEAVEGELCFLQILKVSKVLEVMRLSCFVYWRL